MAEVKLVVKQIDQGSDGIKSVGQSLNGLLDSATKSAAALAAAGATFKKAFDLSQEGANLNQLTQSFEYMNEAVFKTPDLLDDMSAAVRGTIKDTDLMKSLLTLTAGASDDAAQAYAAAAPRLLEIAKASNKLNPALGDTAFLFDSLALGIKRGSPMILDNLGITIKVGEANEKYAASIGKTVDQLTAEEKQMALLNATMEAGDTLISQVGGNVDSQADAWARMTVKVQETTDGFKQFLAEGLYPVIEAASGGYGGAVNNIVQKNIAAGKSMEELVSAGQRMTNTLDSVGAAGLKVTGTYDSFQQGLRDTAMAIIENSNGARDARKNLEEAFGPDLFKNVDDMGTTFVDLGLGVSIFVDEIARASDHSSKFSEDLAALNRMSAEYSVVTGTSAVGAASDYGAELARLSQMGQEAAAAQRLLKEETDAAQQAMNASMVGALNDLPDAYSTLITAQQQLEDSQGEWVQTTVDNAGRIGSVNAQLAADLSDEQAAAMRDILNTVDEGSAEWLNAYNALQGDLSKSQRDALVAQKAELEAANGSMGSAYTGSIEDAKAAQEAIDAANQEIIDSYRELAIEGALALAELSPDPDAIQRTLDYAVAIGEMTQAEADMRLQAAEARLAIEELNQMVVDGTVTAEEAGRAFDLLASGQYNTAAAAVEAGNKQQMLIDLFRDTPEKVETAYTLLMGDSLQRLQAVRDMLNEVDGRHASASVTVNTATAADLGSGGAGKGDGGKQNALGGVLGAGEMSQVGEFNQPELFQSGGKMFLIPGDQGRVFSNSQSNGMMGGVQINGPLIGQVVQRPGESGQRFADRVSTLVTEKIGGLR